MIAPIKHNFLKSHKLNLFSKSCSRRELPAAGRLHHPCLVPKVLLRSKDIQTKSLRIPGGCQECGNLLPVLLDYPSLGFSPARRLLHHPWLAKTVFTRSCERLFLFERIISHCEFLADARNAAISLHFIMFI
jgi:hypothetical protein